MMTWHCCGGVWVLGLPEALIGCVPKEQGVCAETPARSSAYLRVVLETAFVPLVFGVEACLVRTWLLEL